MSIHYNIVQRNCRLTHTKKDWTGVSPKEPSGQGAKVARPSSLTGKEDVRVNDGDA